MEWIRPVESLSAGDRSVAGGKAVNLGAMARAGLNIPAARVVVKQAYLEFVDRTGLRGRVMLELGRKAYGQMRWEEMWDASLRVRSMFAAAAWPQALRGHLATVIQEAFGDVPVVVRSSAPEEDTGRASFAGVHESFVNVRGVDAILEHVKLVWASLFSDRALLYARELGTDVLSSSMAVVVQRLVHGDRSGVTFTQSPTHKGRAVIEAVYGLNQGLVDGTIPPDRWELSRQSGCVESHESTERENQVVAVSAGVAVVPLPTELGRRPPLDTAMISELWKMAARIEALFGAPQDIEWTVAETEPFVVQARPITTLKLEQVDSGRAWYLSLRRSLETLERLRARVEEDHLPAMAREAETLSRRELSSLGDEELDAEVERRRELYRKWHAVYWEEMIPLAHGARLFGELYNEELKPEDPYEFVQLLEGTTLMGVARNDRMIALAARLEARGLDEESRQELERLLEEFGGAFDATAANQAEWSRLLLRMAHRARRPRKRREEENQRLEQHYLEHFAGRESEQARAILDLARASYRLRDDDNIYLGRIEAQVRRAEEEQRRRGRAPAVGPAEPDSEELVLAAGRLASRAEAGEDDTDRRLKARQLVGQPAGPGVARGPARVIRNREDLFDFEEQDILVCDAVDPNMTFVVPLAGGVVERRGGMLIHGAIIAREYGLPCVTGIPAATSQIATGDVITVDGFTGIVTVHSSARRRS